MTEYGDGQVRGILSVCVSDWDVPGFNGRNAEDCSRDEVVAEVWSQLKRSLNGAGRAVLSDDMLHSHYLDNSISSVSTRLPMVLRDAEPLLVNYVDTWRLRPEAVTRIPNLFLASDYVRTFTDIATMEGGNEAARRAVDGVLDATVRRHLAARVEASRAGLPRPAAGPGRRTFPQGPAVEQRGPGARLRRCVRGQRRRIEAAVGPGHGAGGGRRRRPWTGASGGDRPGRGLGVDRPLPHRLFPPLSGRNVDRRHGPGLRGVHEPARGLSRPRAAEAPVGRRRRRAPRIPLRPGRGLPSPRRQGAPIGLCLATAAAYGGDTGRALPSAGALDMLHNAFLVHDDIEDGSESRRGHQTMYVQHGLPLAVNTGDAMQAMAFRLLRENGALLGPRKSERIADEFDHS